MGNLTIEQKEKRHLLETNDFLCRNNIFYTYLEKENNNIFRVVHLFSFECANRSSFDSIGKEFIEKELLLFMNQQKNSVENMKNKLVLNENFSKSDIEFLERTISISHIYKLYNGTFSNEEEETLYLAFLNMCYAWYTFVDKDKELKNYSISIELTPNFIDTMIQNISKYSKNYKIIINEIKKHIDDIMYGFEESTITYDELLEALNRSNLIENKNVLSALELSLRQTGYTPMIYNSIIKVGLTDEMKYAHNKYKAFVEIDFTKSEDEILDFVKQLKRDFDKDPINFGINPFRSIKHIEFADIDICNIKNSDLFQIDHKKGLGGKMADILFIYDCRRVGLSEDYIKDQINKYWIENKKLFTDKISSATYKKYLKFSREQIDQKKYLNFSLGAKIK